MGYWIVDNDERFDNVDELCDFIFSSDNYDDDDAVDDYIDNAHDNCYVHINGVEFSPSEIVRNCDANLYCDLKQEWAEMESEDDREEYWGTLENMEDNDREYINGYTIDYYEDDDEDEDDDEEQELNEHEKVVIKTLMDRVQKIS